jgi:hypothetical protein
LGVIAISYEAELVDKSEYLAIESHLDYKNILNNLKKGKRSVECPG